MQYIERNNLCEELGGSIKGEIKFWRPNKSIIVQSNLLESFFSVIAAVELYCLFQSDQAILVQIKAEEVFHRI